VTRRSSTTTATVPRAVPRWLAALIAFALGLTGVMVAAVAEAAPAAAADAGVQVYVGYADTLRPNPANFPTPWSGSPGVVFAGCTASCSFDAGAVRIVNNSTTKQTISSISVSFDTCTFAMWPGAVLSPGQQYIITQTASGAAGGCNNSAGYFDTSDIGPNGADWSGHCDQSGIIPVVNATIDGVANTFTDSKQVLNTGGVDLASCPPGSNESTQWSLIGTRCSGATLALAPATQTHEVGDTAELDATLANGCGAPLQGSTVDFTIPSGPNAGKTGSAVTDASGVAVFDYTSGAAGTDTVQASTTNPAGTISSNPATVVWVSYLTGRAYGLSASGLVTIPATPDTGYVKTTTAENVQPPCVLTLSGLISAGTLCADVTTSLGPDTSTASASVQKLGISALGIPAIEIGVAQSSSQTSCSGSTGDATVTSVTVGGVPVAVDLHPGPNTTVSVLGVTLTFNEQVPVTGTDKGLTVNAVHINALGLLNVVVASSTSDIAGC
jgi:hypothetical protein